MAKKRPGGSLAAARRAHKGHQQKRQQTRQTVPPVRRILAAYPAVPLSQLLARLRRHLEEQPPEPVDPGPHGKPLVCLFLSFTDATRRAQVVHFTADSAQAIWPKIDSWRQLKLKKIPSVRFLRVDWVTEVETLTWHEAQQRINQSKRNYFRYGLALDSEFHQAFLEQELNANAMLYPGGKRSTAGLNEPNFLKYARERFDKGFQLPEDDHPVCLLTTEGLLLQPEQEPIPLNGYTGGVEGRDSGRRPVPSLTSPLVTDLIQQSSRFLADQVHATGRFVYGIHPCFDRDINAYNTLRHASTTYAMLEALEITRNPDLKAAIGRSLSYLTQQLIRTYPTTGGETLAYLVDDNNEIKLGGNAVCLLALVKYTELSGDRQFLPLLEQLALGIQRLQDEDSGQMVHVLNAHDLSVKDPFRIIYYDGEAAFGLIRLYGLTKDERWLNTVVKAFDYFIEKKHWQNHDHWLSYCVNELTLYRPEERYYQFGIQNVAGYLGFVAERITTFPTLLELMMAAHKMITRLKTSDDHRHLLKQLDLNEFYRALETRARYLLNGFFWPEFAIYFQNPQRILGSFFIRHHSFRVRIDDVEHYLSGFVAYLHHYLPEPYTFGRPPLDGASAPIPSELPSAWSREHVTRATPGQWVVEPSSQWQATGVSFTKLSMQPGHMVAVRSATDSRRGIPASQLAGLPEPPSALIVADADQQELPTGIPRYRVPSVGDAVLNLGRYARDQFAGRVVGITGSAGKTSTVELLQDLLSHWGETGASRLSANLPYGVAWNLASMNSP